MKAVAWIGLVLSIAWFFNAPGFEPALACIGSLITLGGLTFREKKAKIKSDAVRYSSINSAPANGQGGRAVAVESQFVKVLK